MTTSIRRASVIIPAHQEESVIATALHALPVERLEVVVAANGCTDRTVEIARSFDGVTVLDLPMPGKAPALNAADEAATVFPRLYLDADVLLEDGALDALIEATSTPEPVLATAPAAFDTAGCSAPVRAFFDVFAALPYAKAGYSSGVYALSASARARFGEFPQMDADDLFVQRHFGPYETVVVPAKSIVRAPKDLRRLLRIRTRAARGATQLETEYAQDERFETTTTSTLQALVDLVRRSPTRIPEVAVYVGVTVAARVRARRAGTWERDDSTR